MRQRDRVTVVAAGLAIATAVLAIGGAPRWSLAALAVPTVVAIGAQLTSRRGLERVAPLLALLGIALGLTAAQAVPVPVKLQASLDPVGHEMIEENRLLLGDPAPKLAPLSVDPPATRRAALDLMLAFALAWVLLRVASAQQGRYLVLAGVAGVCGLAAVIGALDKLLGANDLYGLYTPHHATPTILGPLLNPNSYGSLLVLGAMVSGGLALHGTQPTPLRAAWTLNAVLCLVVSFATLSRGAALAAGIGAVVTATVWLSGRRWRDRRERKKPQFLRVTIPAAILVVCGLALVVLTSAGGVGKQLEDTSLGTEYADPLSKYAAWRSSEQLVRETPWIGVGRGAFETAFTRVHPESAFGTFSHLENEYLQAVVDWGIPGAAALGLAAAWLALTAARRRRDGALAAGALGGLAAVAAQATVDFGLELPGLLIPTIAVAATVSYVPLREINPSRLRRAWGGRALMICGIALGVFLVVPSWGATVSEDHDMLLDDDPPTIELAREVMRRHPLDYFAPARAAVALFAKGDPTAMKHLNRSLELHPTLPDVHRLAARVLAATSHGAQAKLEYQIAMRYTQNPLRLVGEILATFPKTDDAAGAFWLDYPDPDQLARSLGEWKRPDVTLRFLEALVAHDHADKKTIDLETLALLEQTAIDQNDLATAESTARERLARDAGVRARLDLGRVLRKRGKLTDAEQVLGVPVQGPPEQVDATHLLLCDVILDEKKPADAEACLRKMMESSNLAAPMLREIHSRLATIAEQRGDLHRAQLEHALVQGLSQ
jgi:hypothetical protein